MLADNGAWHHFTVGAEPGALSSADTPRVGVPTSRGPDARSVAGGPTAFGVAATALALVGLMAGPRRRRRVIAVGVVLFVLGPTVALAQTTTQVIEYYTTDALGSVRAVTKQVGTS
jgi:hypothetical protein